MPLHRPAKHSKYIPGMRSIQHSAAAAHEERTASVKRDALHERRKMKIVYLLFSTKGYFTSLTLDPNCSPMD